MLENAGSWTDQEGLISCIKCVDFLLLIPFVYVFRRSWIPLEIDENKQNSDVLEKKDEVSYDFSSLTSEAKEANEAKIKLNQMAQKNKEETSKDTCNVNKSSLAENNEEKEKPKEFVASNTSNTSDHVESRKNSESPEKSKSSSSSKLEEENEPLILEEEIIHTQNLIQKEIKYNRYIVGIILLVALIYLHFQIENLCDVIETMIEMTSLGN